MISEALNYDTFFNDLSIYLVFFCVAPEAPNTSTKQVTSITFLAADLHLFALISEAHDYSTLLRVYPKFLNFYPYAVLRRRLAHATSGSVFIRFPVSTNKALATAGASGGTPGSPTPPGGRSLGTIWVSTSGACASVTTG